MYHRYVLLYLYRVPLHLELSIILGNPTLSIRTPGAMRNADTDLHV